MLIPLGFYGILYVPNILVVQGDIIATIDNVISHNMLFRLSIVFALATQIVNIVLVIYLYRLLKPVNSSQSALMVVFSLLAVPIALINELNHSAILILNGLYHPGNIGDAQYILLVELFLNLHEYGIVVAQIFWGLWVLPMGLLIIKSEFIPKILGVLMLIAGTGYIIDVFNWFIFPGFEFEFSTFTFMGEK